MAAAVLDTLVSAELRAARTPGAVVAAGAAEAVEAGRLHRRIDRISVYSCSRIQ
jgi:hypothetical protein